MKLKQNLLIPKILRDIMFNGNMKKIMKQAKQMQDQMMKTQKS